MTVSALPLPPRGDGARRWHAWLATLAARDDDLSAPTSGDVGSAADLPDFEHFFYQHEPVVSAYLRRFVGDEQSAYDLSQETFLRAWQHFGRIRSYERPIAWLLRVATHLALKHRHRQATPIGSAAPLDDAHPPISRDPITQIAESEQIAQILRDLPPKERALLLLRDVAGLSGPEAAETLGISLAAARKLLTRARQAFRARYLRHEEA